MRTRGRSGADDNIAAWVPKSFAIVRKAYATNSCASAELPVKRWTRIETAPASTTSMASKDARLVSALAAGISSSSRLAVCSMWTRGGMAPAAATLA